MHLDFLCDISFKNICITSGEDFLCLHSLLVLWYIVEYLIIHMTLYPI
jgi:hypothetical protein